MAKKYTIHDIAEASGVSRGTVSRVLNNHHAVSEKTRQVVLRVIEELNYRPNFSARHMRTASSNLIGFGLIGDEVTTTPYAVDMIRGAQDTLWLEGKVMLTTSGGYESQMTQSAFEAMLERRVEGIIYAAVFHRPVELPFDPGETPIVFANCYSKDRKYPSVVPDEFGGGYTATRTLIEAGHRRIAFINLGIPHEGLTPKDAANGRLRGYQQALQDNDIPLDETLVKYTDFLTETNYQLTENLMQQPDAPTAIFCGTDRIAMGCYIALISMGLKIPGDVAVIGYDNQQDIGSGLTPGLTTIQLPHYEMGLWAVEYLSKHRGGDNFPPIQHKIACPLVQRGSV